MKYYAHSGVSDKDIVPQSYEDHARGVFYSCLNQSYIFDNHPRRNLLVSAILIAALYHDLGKLDESAQPILSAPDRITDAKIINHVEAGVIYCLGRFRKTGYNCFLLAAYLIHAHHIGLMNQSSLFEYKNDPTKIFGNKIEFKEDFKDNKDIEKTIKTETGTVHEYVKKKVRKYIGIHNKLLNKEVKYVQKLKKEKTHYQPESIDLRMCLSLLGEGDHMDTSLHYGLITRNPNKLLPEKRLKNLIDYVEVLKRKAKADGISDEVIDSRNKLLNSCLNDNEFTERFYRCDGPVGKGKTLSSTTKALKLAIHHNLERINYVIPYTNIIDQTVSVLQQCLIGEEEKERLQHLEYIVNPIHSSCEYDNWWLRKYSRLWDCPINVSTSVQFFETLFSNKPSKLRKLSKFANSVIIFDEYHTTIPHHMWNICLKTLKHIGDTFNIYFIFSSGTDVSYWDIYENHEVNIHDIVGDDLFEDFKSFEDQRILYEGPVEIDTDRQLYKMIRENCINRGKLKYNTCVVMNTVKSALAVANHFRMTYKNIIVKHLSSCLAPYDRVNILEEIRQLLLSDKKVLVVATSVVECGIDFSFQIGFREYGPFSSTIQFGGRINRNREYQWGKVIEFILNQEFIDNSSEFSWNPMLNNAIEARQGYDVNIENCTQIIMNELGKIREENDYIGMEEQRNFLDMKESFRVINTPVVQVIVDPDIYNRMLNGEIIPSNEINMKSVNLYPTTLDRFEDEESIETYFIGEEEIHVLTGPYDPTFYGIYANG